MIVERAYVYMITYPNGKIYIGRDRTDDINYFGSANGSIIELDFSIEERNDFTIRKRVLERHSNIEVRELNRREKEYILQYKSNDPAIGYNRYPGIKKIDRKKQHVYENSKNQ